MLKQFIKKAIRATGYEIRRISGSSMFVPYIKDIKLDGTDFKFWINSEGTEYWYSEENFLLEIAQLKRLIQPGDRILDVGCNIGVLATIMAKYTGMEGSLLAIDIFPDNCLTTSAQLGLNKLTNCEVLNIGASDKEEEVSIENKTNSEIVLNPDNKNMLKVKALPIDLIQANRGSFDLLKIDVEGFEVSVLKGARKLLEKKPKIALELHGPHLKGYNTSVEELFEVIQINNYEGFILHKYSNKFEVFDAEKALREPPLANLFLTPKK